jgi:hypothetical protein
MPLEINRSFDCVIVEGKRMLKIAFAEPPSQRIHDAINAIATRSADSPYSIGVSWDAEKLAYDIKASVMYSLSSDVTTPIVSYLESEGLRTRRIRANNILPVGQTIVFNPALIWAILAFLFYISFKS